MALFLSNLLSAALKLDGEGKSLVASVKYTEALIELGGALLESFKSADAENFVASTASKKYLGLITQCVDRLNVLLSAIPVIDEPSASSDVSSIEIAEDVAESNSSFSSDGSSDPVQEALEENRRLILKHQEKLRNRVMPSSEIATANMTLQRKLTENLELAEQKKRMLQQQRAKVRQSAMDSLAKDPVTAGLSSEEKEFIVDVQTFENNCPELRLLSSHLNEQRKNKNPDFSSIREHYIDSILSNVDHPFSVKLRKIKHDRTEFLVASNQKDAINQPDIYYQIENDLNELLHLFLHGLQLKADIKPNERVLISKLREIYLTTLMPALKHYYRRLRAKEMEEFNDKCVKLRQETPSEGVFRAALTLKSLNDALSPNSMLDVVVATCKALSCDSPDDSPSENRHPKVRNADDLILTLADVVVEAKTADVIVWLAIMEAFLDERRSLGEEGYCLTSLNAAVYHIMHS